MKPRMCRRQTCVLFWLEYYACGRENYSPTHGVDTGVGTALRFYTVNTPPASGFTLQELKTRLYLQFGTLSGV